MKIGLADPAATARLGQRLGDAFAMIDRGLVVYLAGELGAGKTALVRAIIQGLGHGGPVVSPSYTLVEPYTLGQRVVHHLDLYRLGDPEELEFLGIRELNAESDLIFVEWAERGRGFLPPADLFITMAYDSQARQAQIDADSAAGERLIEILGASSGDRPPERRPASR